MKSNQRSRWGWAVPAVLLLGLVGCNSNKSPLTIFHTNDIHSHLRAAKIDPFGLGGLAHLSTLIRQLRKDSGPSLMLDAGDWSEGTWYYDVNTGANMLRFLGILGCDGAALGNHDFLSGPARLRDTVTEAQVAFPVLAANLEMSQFADPAGLLKAIPPYTIKTVGDLTVGIIGLTTFELLYDAYIKPVHITNPIDAATAVAKELRPKVDVLLIVSHNSFDVNMEVGKAVPGVDAVISGHSHRKVPKAILVKNAGRDVPIVEAGEWGKFLGELNLEVDKDKKLVRMTGYRLHPVTSDIPEDPVVVKMIADQDKILGDRIHDDVNRVVADAEIDFRQHDNWETPLGNLAVRAYRSASGADVALEEISLTGVSIHKGDVTLMDLHDVVPHIYNPATGKDWGLFVWNASGADLSLMINVFYSITSLVPLSNPLGWLSSDGASIVWDPGSTARVPAPGGKSVPAVKAITIGGHALDPNAHYKVAISEGLLFAMQMANDKFHLGLDLSNIIDTGQEVWTAIATYAENAHTLTAREFRVGGHARTQGADLAIFEYGIDWDKANLSVEVENQGLLRSGTALLTCYAGLPNDLIAYGTELQKWSEIGHASVGPLDPDGSAAFKFPWKSTALETGKLPVQCTVSVDGDVFPPNNSADRVFYNPAL